MSTTELVAQVGQLVSGAALTYAREDFLKAVDEQDKVIYMSVARQIAEDLQCEIHVSEDNMIFIKKPALRQP